MNIDPALYRRIADEIREEYDDEEMVADFLEGETDFHEVLGRILEGITEAEVMALANDEASKRYAERKAKMLRRKDRMRALALSMVEATGQKSIKHALGTVSVTPGKRKIYWSGEASSLPEYLQRWSVAPDLVAIKEALERGDHVEGAALGNGAPSVRITR